jgi:hypothetical protein
MEQREKFEAALRKAKIAWRKVVESPNSTPAEKRQALVQWKRALATRELALIAWKRARVERRKTILDRRKAGADGDWAGDQAERRKTTRRP